MNNLFLSLLYVSFFSLTRLVSYYLMLLMTVGYSFFLTFISLPAASQFISYLSWYCCWTSFLTVLWFPLLYSRLFSLVVIFFFLWNRLVQSSYLISFTSYLYLPFFYGPFLSCIIFFYQWTVHHSYSLSLNIFSLVFNSIFWASSWISFTAGS